MEFGLAGALFSIVALSVVADVVLGGDNSFFYVAEFDDALGVSRRVD